MIVAFDHSEEVANNIRTFWFKPEKKVDYAAGQFIEMMLPHKDCDERGQKRWFTLSSSPTEQLISITTKLSSDRISTFKKKLFGLKPGVKITISEPMGDFVLPKDPTIPLLFVAGSIGVTPVRSMLKYLIDKNQQRPIQIIYGAQKLIDIAFKDMFKAYGAAVDIILSEPLAEWAGGRGRLSVKTILSLSANPDPLIYISGPEPMVEKLEADLLKAGVPPSKLVLDFYLGYPTI